MFRYAKLKFQKKALVLSRNVRNIVFKSCTNFLSRNVVHKFENESKEVFRRLEKFTKCVIRTNGQEVHSASVSGFASVYVFAETVRYHSRRQTRNH